MNMEAKDRPSEMAKLTLLPLAAIGSQAVACAAIDEGSFPEQAA